MMVSTDLAQQAETLARRGDVRAGHALLEENADRGDPAAWFALARWYLTGTFIPRNLGQSRICFARAAALGHSEAARILGGFLATGTGGQRDWPSAISMLATRADSDETARRELAAVQAMDLTPEGDPADVVTGAIISERPHLTVFKGLLTPMECDFLVRTATTAFSPSMVVDPASGQLIRNTVRTSDVAAFPLIAEGPAISAINRRIACHSGTLPSQGEPLQVLRYRNGQQYRAHFDGLTGAQNQRIMTTLIYLNHGYGGGETAFLKTGLTFRGEPGDALLFRNVQPNGHLDEMSLHAGLPVTHGEKLLASRWIRARPLDLSAPAGRI